MRLVEDYNQHKTENKETFASIDQKLTSIMVDAATTAERTRSMKETLERIDRDRANSRAD